MRSAVLNNCLADFAHNNALLCCSVEWLYHTRLCADVEHPVLHSALHMQRFAAMTDWQKSCGDFKPPEQHHVSQAAQIQCFAVMADWQKAVCRF